jgi:hypothetical protein
VIWCGLLINSEVISEQIKIGQYYILLQQILQCTSQHSFVIIYAILKLFYFSVSVYVTQINVEVIKI